MNIEYHSQVEQRQRAIVPYLAAQAKTRDYLEDDWSPVIYPLAAHIMDRFGQDISGYRVIIEDILAHHAALYTSSVSAQLWTALYLKRLGYVPPPAGSSALKRSRLVTELSTHDLMNRLDLAVRKGGNQAEDIAAIYDLTHEVFALTDFGALAPPAFIAQHRPYFNKLFDRALQWASAGQAVDILAELLICTELLHLPRRGLPVTSGGCAAAKSACGWHLRPRPAAAPQSLSPRCLDRRRGLVFRPALSDLRVGRWGGLVWAASIPVHGEF